jgi:hypothetical protein
MHDICLIVDVLEKDIEMIPLEIFENPSSCVIREYEKSHPILWPKKLVRFHLLTNNKMKIKLKSAVIGIFKIADHGRFLYHLVKVFDLRNGWNSTISVDRRLFFFFFWRQTFPFQSV